MTSLFIAQSSITLIVTRSVARNLLTLILRPIVKGSTSRCRLDLLANRSSSRRKTFLPARKGQPHNNVRNNTMQLDGLLMLNGSSPAMAPGWKMHHHRHHQATNRQSTWIITLWMSCGLRGSRIPMQYLDIHIHIPVASGAPRQQLASAYFIWGSTTTRLLALLAGALLAASAAAAAMLFTI